MARAKRTVVVADATKLGRVALAQIAGLDAADQLITTTGADAAELQRLRDAGLPVTSV
jgi:DeoR family transcriptional regulator, aga operon transcriptional repressor